MLEMKSEIIETHCCTMWLDEDGITHQVFHNGAEISLADVQELLHERKRLLNGSKGPIFSDIRSIKSVSKEARDSSTDDEGIQITTAFAILIGNPVSRMIGNFTLRINRPPYPTKCLRRRIVPWSG